MSIELAALHPALADETDRPLAASRRLVNARELDRGGYFRLELGPLSVPVGRPNAIPKTTEFGSSSAEELNDSNHIGSGSSQRVLEPKLST